MDRILKELCESFSVSGKELLIIEALSKSKLSAHEISKKTNIPIGRIYDYLNNLINVKLIERSEKKPYIYSIEKLDENIIEFLKYNFDETIRKQNKMMYLLEHRSKNFDEIDIVTNSDDFSFRTIQLVKESKFIKNIVRHGSIPFPLYPEKSEDFLKVRTAVVENRDTLSHTTPEMTFMIYRTHDEAYKNGKNMEYIVEESALKFHFDMIKQKFGQKFFTRMKQEIKERLKKYNVKIFVINEFVPIQTFITEQKVFLSLIHQKHTQGLIITNEAAVHLYNTYFEETKKRCKEIKKHL
jgi:sugar-specific transcriptional regulator TrmB